MPISQKIREFAENYPKRNIISVKEQARAFINAHIRYKQENLQPITINWDYSITSQGEINASYWPYPVEGAEGGLRMQDMLVDVFELNQIIKPPEKIIRIGNDYYFESELPLLY